MSGFSLPVNPVELSDDGTALVSEDGDFLVVSSEPPNDSDGRANGTIYIQTA